MASLGQAGPGTGRGDGGVGHWSMACRGNRLPGCEDRAANRAMASLGQTGLGAGRGNGGIGDGHVAGRGNRLLGREERAANRTLAALRQTGLGAGRGNGGIGDGHVAGCGNGLLCHDDRAADRAVAALCPARCGAGGGHGGVLHDLVIRLIHVITPFLGPCGDGGIAEGMEGGSLGNVLERRIGNAGGIAEDRDVRQAVALFKGGLINYTDALRNDDALKILAFVEGFFLYFAQNGWECDGFQVGAAAEGAFTNDSNAVRYDDPGQCFAVLKCAIVNLTHIPRDGNIGKFNAPVKTVFRDITHLVGQHYAGQARTFRKYSITCIRHAVWNDNTLQRGTSLKCVVINMYHIIRNS